MDRQVGPIETPEFLGAGMDMHQLGLRAGNVEQAVALRSELAEASADQQDQIGILDARDKLGIGADTKVARVARMQRIEQRQPAIAGRNRQREALGEPLHRLARRRRPAAAADDRDRTLCLGQKLAELAHVGGPRRGLDRLKGRSLVGDNALSQHVLRKPDHNRTRAAIGCGVERARNDLRHARGIVDFGHPFRHAAERRRDSRAPAKPRGL